jgi:hypothetical protein
MLLSEQDHLLHRVVSGHFLFPSAGQDFTPSVVPCHPDLAQEVAVSIAMEDELGFVRSPRRYARIGQHQIGGFRVRITDGKGRSLII